MQENPRKRFADLYDAGNDYWRQLFWRRKALISAGESNAKRLNSKPTKTDTLHCWTTGFRWSVSRVFDVAMAGTVIRSLLVVSVLYWWLVLPLTLLSGWLIFVKPRKAKSGE